MLQRINWSKLKRSEYWTQVVDLGLRSLQIRTSDKPGRQEDIHTASKHVTVIANGQEGGVCMKLVRMLDLFPIYAVLRCMNGISGSIE